MTKLSKMLYKIFPVILSLLLILACSMNVFADPEDESGYEDTLVEDTIDAPADDTGDEEDTYYEDTADDTYEESLYDDTYDDSDYEEPYDDSYEDNYDYSYEEPVYDTSYDDPAPAETTEETTEDKEKDQENTETEKPKKPARSAADGWPKAPELISNSVLMIELNTGVVMYEQNINERCYPASTTKIMTCLIALENCSLNETVTYSKEAVTLEEGASNIGAVEGEQMSMKDCLYGLMLPSGNECANAIAEHVAGSIDAFCKMMTERAAALGCTDTNFTNPHGLFDKDHYTTAHDMGLIAQAAFNNSALREIISHHEYTIPATNKNPESRKLKSTDEMVTPKSEFYNEYVIGGKTGYLPESGRCLVALSKKDNMSIVTVTLNSSTYNGVFRDTLELLDYAFEDFVILNAADFENRFQFSNSEAPVMLDPAAQVLMPSYVTPSDLESDISFADDMDLTSLRTLEKESGISEEDGRSLYAVIDYSFDDVSIGKANVILNNRLSSKIPEFAEVFYIRKWLLIAAAALVVIIVIMFIMIGAARRRR